MNLMALERAYEWYTSGPRQRLQPGGQIICVMTRWNVKDLTGMLMQAQSEAKADQWELVEFPAIMPSGKPVWPEYWKLGELETVKASLSLGKWNAQWMQNPTSEEGAIIKREWWKKWDHSFMPKLEHVIQSYDTAFMKTETADYSAITTWGVFRESEDKPPNLILVDALKGRYEFHFTPSKGNDKHTRVNSVAPLFESGTIWAPTHKSFAQEVMEECAAFPYGDHDDLVDSMTQAVMRFRQGGLIPHPEDYKDEKIIKTKRVYY